MFNADKSDPRPAKDIPGPNNPVVPIKPVPTKPIIQPGFTQMIDISKYQPTVKWSAVRNFGFEAVVTKCTDGDELVDPLYSTHAKNALENGFPFGGYCFNRFSADPVKQAEHFVRTINNKTRWLIADIEFDKSSKTIAKFGDKYTKQMDDYAADHSIKFLERVTAISGITPWIYLNGYHFVGFKSPERFLKYPCWISNYIQKRKPVRELDLSLVHLPKPYSKKDVVAWQYTDSHSAGQELCNSNGLDANVCYLSVDSLKAIAKV